MASNNEKWREVIEKNSLNSLNGGFSLKAVYQLVIDNNTPNENPFEGGR